MFRIVLTPPTVRHLLQHKKNLHFANIVDVCVSCDSHNNEYSAHTALLYWSLHFIRTVYCKAGTGLRCC
jgi:hypothetical protein